MASRQADEQATERRHVTGRCRETVSRQGKRIDFAAAFSVKGCNPEKNTHINMRRDVGMRNGGSDGRTIAPIGLSFRELRVSFYLGSVVVLAIVIVVSYFFSFVV